MHSYNIAIFHTPQSCASNYPGNCGHFYSIIHFFTAVMLIPCLPTRSLTVDTSKELNFMDTMPQKTFVKFEYIQGTGNVLLKLLKVKLTCTCKTFEIENTITTDS